MKFGQQVLPEFVVVQHERDRQVLEGLKYYFKCGYIKINQKYHSKISFQEFALSETTHKNLDSSVTQHSDQNNTSSNRLCFVVRNQKHLWDIIIPFFEKHKLKTKKRIDFEKFRQILLLMQQQQHLTESGLEHIQKIVHAMRKYYVLTRKDHLRKGETTCVGPTHQKPNRR